jgi:YVTN family beta-propeller protein
MKKPLRYIQALLVLFAFALLTQSVPAQTFVYTNDNVNGPNSVTAFSVGTGGALSLLSPISTFPTGGFGSGTGFYAAHGIAVTSMRHFLFAANNNPLSNNISAFSINTMTGALTFVNTVGAWGTTNGYGISLALTPDNQFLYAAVPAFPSSASTISTFRINSSTGALTLVGSAVSLPDWAFGINVSPDGKFLAVPVAGTVTIFSIASTGALTSVGSFPQGGNGGPTYVDFNCQSDLLFAAHGSLGPTQVSVDTISSTGALNQITNSPFTFNDGYNSNVGVLSPDGRYLFVSNQDSYSITSLNVASGGGLTENGSPLSSIRPFGMATDRAGTLLYAASTYNGSSDGVAGFSIANGVLTPVGFFPTGVTSGALLSLAVFPPKSCPRAYVTNAGSNSVSVVDIATNTVVATVPVGRNPVYSAVTPDGTKAYVANSGANSVSVIDTATNTVVATLTVGMNPATVAITPDGTKAYVINTGANSVSVIDTATNIVVTTVPVGRNPVDIAITPDGTKAYVTNAGAHSVSVISTATNSVLTTVSVGSNPVDIAVTPDGSKAYVTNRAAHSVSVISTATNSVLTTVSVGSNPVDIAITADGTEAFITNANANSVSVVGTATNSVVATVPVGTNPVNVALH